MKTQREKNKVFTRRSMILGAGKLSLLSILIARFSYLQILSNTKYRALAENNSIKIIIIQPLRGLLLDKNGVIIADNQCHYSVVLDKKNIKQAASIIKYSNELLGYETYISKIGLKRALLASGRDNHILIQNHLSWSDIAKIEVRNDLPGLEIMKNQKRHYTYNEVTAHITGYIAKPTQSEIEGVSIPNYQNFLIGKNGVEKIFNKELLGNPGAKKIEVNATGKFMRELLYQAPSRGDTLKLALDIQLQKIVARNLENIHGSAVVLNALSGEVLAIHSTPSYDPNRFIGGVDSSYWHAIKNNSGKPLINKAISTPYPPGSIFKIVTALAILNHGIDPERNILCTGEHQVGNRKFRCHRAGGHGLVNFRSALAKSCNIYFYVLGLQAGIDEILNAAQLLGFNAKTEIELPFEHQGFLPNKAWIKKRLKGFWGAGDTTNTTIGQGYVLATPIQLVVAAARIATGLYIQPTMLLRNKSIKRIDIKESYLQLIRHGLYDVFNSPGGTGYSRRIYDERFIVSGKTGTAQVASQSQRNQVLQYKMRDHGLFAGYLQYGDLTYAVSVVAEHSGWGSVSALPVAISALQEYLQL